MIKLHKQGGYSIVETILYTALFAMLSIFIINALLGMMKTYKNVQANHELLESSHVTFELITREIRNAKSIDTGVSVFDTNPGTLKLNTTDASDVAKTVKFLVSSGTLKYYENDVLTDDITLAKVSITSLIFRKILTTKGQAVRVEMTLQSLRNTAKSITLYDTVALRSKYDN